jgi:glycosyltransferase involved in cell wall biosynthesis
MPSAALSVIIPAYNAAEFLGATINSCLRLDPPAREVIVVDDGSTDDTESVARSFGERIRYIRVDNGGVSRARNIGAEHSTGEWILFLDADDMLLPAGPSALVRAAEAGNAGVAYGLVLVREKPPSEPRTSGYNYAEGDPPLPALRNYWRCAVVTPGSAVVRRDLHSRIGGFVPGYEPMEDRDYWIKAGLLESCAHADHVVLDKTWRPVSAGKMDAKRIWNGLRSRLALPEWCVSHGVPWPAGLPRDERTLFEKAVNEAVWCGCWEIVGPLLSVCRRHSVRTFWTMRAAVGLAWRGGAKRFPAPNWLTPWP